MSLGENVFERSGPSTMSARGFYGVLGLTVAFGLWLSSLMAAEFTAWHPSLMMILLVGLGIPILGIVIATKSDNPAISFIGFLMVAVPFGMLMGPTLNEYSPEVVQKAMFYTAATTLLMGLAGVLYPNIFSRMGGALFMALIGLVVVRVIGIFIPSLGNMGLIDYFSAGLFSLYIGYDMYRASVMPRTMKNAIDAALALYLDIIILYQNLRRIFGAD